MHALRSTVVWVTVLALVALVALAGHWMLDNQTAFDRRTTDSICRVSDRC